MDCTSETRTHTEKFEPKESIIFVPLELPTIGTVSARKRQLSQSETVSSGKIVSAASELSTTVWVSAREVREQ
jgi:hypothetical protein